MGITQSSRFCRRCSRRTLHLRRTFPVWVGVLLTLLTAGLFLPVWALVIFHELFARRHHCQVCGATN